MSEHSEKLVVGNLFKKKKDVLNFSFLVNIKSRTREQGDEWVLSSSYIAPSLHIRLRFDLKFMLLEKDIC